MIDIIFGTMGLLALYFGVGFIFYDILYECFYLNLRLNSPIWKPFIYILWPASFVLIVIFMIVEVIADWIKECKEYYAKDMED